MATPVKKQIEVTVDKDGSINIEGHGFKGGDCEKATSFLEKALGLIKSKLMKRERYGKDENVLNQH